MVVAVRKNRYAPQGGSMKEDASKLFVSGLPGSVSEQELRRLFEASGTTVVEIRLPTERATGRGHGFAVVTVATAEEAANACASLHGFSHSGKKIGVRPFPGDAPPPRDAAPGAASGDEQPGSEASDAGPEAVQPWWEASERRCLRCKTVPLTVLPGSCSEIAFFGCPECERHHALLPGKQLTFRWLHPISLVLYSVQFDESPAGREEEIARSLIRSRPVEHLEYIVREIRLELEEPTQQVRDILDCRGSESDLRAFLRSVAGKIATTLLEPHAE
jgi:hypothetical protein